jgi:integrase
MKYIGLMPTPDNLSSFVIGMREAGLSITTCNISVRSFNPFLKWLETKGHIPSLKLTKLTEEKKQLRVFSDEVITKIINFKPKGRNEQRIYAMIMTMLETGMRIDSCLNLEKDRIDFDNLLITLTKTK